MWLRAVCKKRRNISEEAASSICNLDMEARPSSTA
jgi:hypothetical protein